MADNRYTVYYPDGSGGYALPEPLAATWEFPVIDEAPDGNPIVAGVGAVRWSFAALTYADHDAIKARRGTRGQIRILTKDDDRQWVTVDARIDPNPGAPNFWRGEARNITIEFRRAEVV